MKTFYVRPLNANGSKWCAYEMVDGKLDVVWPQPTGDDRKTDIALEVGSREWMAHNDRAYLRAAKRIGMRRNGAKGPNFVYRFGGGGYCKATALAELLCQTFGECVVYDLNDGYSPHKVGHFVMKALPTGLIVPTYAND